MAITYDAPSTNWQTASQITAPAIGRVVYPIYQNTSAQIFEKQFSQNTEYWGPLALGTSMQSDTLDGALGTSDTTVTVDSTTGFPSAGTIKISSELITYTGTSSTTFTGCTRGAKGTTASSHSDGAVVSAAIYLVEETPITEIGGGLVEWTRRYATIPDDWTDYDERPFTFVGYYSDPTDTNYRAPLMQNVTWEISHTYLQTTDPYADFDVSAQLFQSKDSDGAVLDYVDDSSTPTYSTYAGYVSAGTRINVSHNTLERYAGNIWVQKTFKSKAL